jgi:hypothetical protein
MTAIAIHWGIIALNVLCSMAGSFLFLFAVLLLLRPSIKISPHISKEFDKDEQQWKFVFKIVNTSLFSAYDVKAEVTRLERYPVDDGSMNVKMLPLKLKYDRLEHLPRHRRQKKCKPYALHATRFKTFDNQVEEILKDQQKSIQFSITARHGLSGLSKHFKHEFADGQALREAPFKFGNSLEVKNI